MNRRTHTGVDSFPTDGMVTFKKSVDPKDRQRRRHNMKLELRKSQKEENLARKRLSSPENVETKSPDGTVIYSIDDVPELVDVLMKQNPSDEELVFAVRDLRRIATAATSTIMEAIVGHEAVPALVKCLGHPNMFVQNEAAWTLVNVAASDYTAVVVQAGAVPVMISLANFSPKPEVREGAILCLGNIALHSASFRDGLLNGGIVGSL